MWYDSCVKLPDCHLLSRHKKKLPILYFNVNIYFLGIQNFKMLKKITHYFTLISEDNTLIDIWKILIWSKEAITGPRHHCRQLNQMWLNVNFIDKCSLPLSRPNLLLNYCNSTYRKNKMGRNATFLPVVM